MKPMPVIKPSITFAMPSGECTSRAFTGLHEPAACHRDQREGSQARASRTLLAIPADRNREREGRGQGDEMSADLKFVQARPRKNQKPH